MSAFDYEGCLMASSASKLEFSRNKWEAYEECFLRKHCGCSRSFAYAPLLHF